MNSDIASAPVLALTEENFSKGFLVDDEWIAGVTELPSTTGGTVFAAYVSHYLTGETIQYQEFPEPRQAIDFIRAIDRAWVYEAIGCDTHGSSAKSCSKSCSGCG
ncbi:MAG TPA: hypothetical protein PLH57_11245 [Oligoflexia bacterium]|nr:hypothetical protein [Oligoflexia bacterium]